MTFHARGVKALRHHAGAAYLRVLESAMSRYRTQPSRLTIERFSCQKEFEAYVANSQRELAQRLAIEQTLAQNTRTFRTPGFCFVCSRWTHFHSSWAWSYECEGRKQINWREQLLCRFCGLNNRMRAAIHLLAELRVSFRDLDVYATEQTTRLFGLLRERCRSLVGSEYLGDGSALGTSNSTGIVNQDLTRLTFANECFDLILSFEVVEHIPDYCTAFAECARVLKPGGKMLFSTPFDPSSPCNRIRAKVRPDGTIEHVLPPEYHGDPLSSDGCLCFQHFGWEMLEQMKQAGFKQISALLYHSRDYGYFGKGQIQFLAER